MTGIATRGPRLTAYTSNRTSTLEQAVMDRFEAGMRDREQIATEVGVPADRVRMVLSYMAPKVTDRWAKDAARSSQLLVDAIRRHHPEQVPECGG